MKASPRTRPRLRPQLKNAKAWTYQAQQQKSARQPQHRWGSNFAFTHIHKLQVTEAADLPAQGWELWLSHSWSQVCPSDNCPGAWPTVLPAGRKTECLSFFGRRSEVCGSMVFQAAVRTLKGLVFVVLEVSFLCFSTCLFGPLLGYPLLFSRRIRLFRRFAGLMVATFMKTTVVRQPCSAMSFLWGSLSLWILGTCKWGCWLLGWDDKMISASNPSSGCLTIWMGW